MYLHGVRTDCFANESRHVFSINGFYNVGYKIHPLYIGPDISDFISKNGLSALHSHNVERSFSLHFGLVDHYAK